MKKLILIIAVSFSSLSFSNNDVKPEKTSHSSCEETIASSLEMYESVYGCMDSGTYNSVRKSMMSRC